MVAWSSAKTKVQLRLSVQRLRMLQEKKEALAKKARRDIGTLLEKGKVETAKLRVESMINEDIHVELLELLELYCELLIARFGILDNSTREPDPQISEAVCSIIYAATRTEVKELQVLREMLMHKYGREFSIGVMDNKDSCVSERVIKKVAPYTPEASLVSAYLGEIARTYNIPYEVEEPLTLDDDGDDAGGGGGLRDKVLDRELEPPILAEPPTTGIDIVKHSDKPNIPSLPPTEDEKRPAKSPTPAKATPPPAEAPGDEFDALARRFAALKKR